MKNNIKKLRNGFFTDTLTSVGIREIVQKMKID